MSGDVRDRARFTFQAGREIKRGFSDNVCPGFYTVQKQHTSKLWMVN